MSPSRDESRRWFYVREGRRLGPVETARLVDLVLSGEVSEESLVWHSGLPEWLKAREVEEIRRELPPPVPMAPPPPPPAPVAPPPEEGAEAPDTAPPGAATPSASAEDGNGARADAPGEGNGNRRRKRRRHRHRDSKRRPAWLWPLIVVLVALMIFLWWLLRRMNEVPPGRIIQTGSHEARPGPEGPALGRRSSGGYRVALGREPSVTSSVTSRPARITTKGTLSPGFFSPSA